MENRTRLAGVGHLAFFFSGVCAIASGVIVNLLQERYGFSYSMIGTLLSVMSIGNMAASFAAGLLPARLGNRNTVALLCSGYFLGYVLMGFFGAPGLLMACFAMLGIAKGGTINNCTVLVGSNSPDRARGLTLMHAFYATGAMLCPFLISGLRVVHPIAPMLGLAAVGMLLWLTFMTAGLSNTRSGKDGGEKTDFSFLRSPSFWLLTALIFCQNGAENAVNGWMVTYYRSAGLLSGTLSTYTMTIMWGSTLIARLIIAFCLKVKDTFGLLAIMGLTCTVMYLGLVLAASPIMAVTMLFLFAFSIAGVNPVGMAGVGKMLNAASVGILIPIASLGAIVMPWIIGIAADSLGLQVAMAINLIPCLGMFVISAILRKKQA